MKTNLILVVEDDNDVRETLADILRSSGYQVHEASNGHEALASLLKIPPPSLVILDAMMPVMDGPTFYAEFRKIAKYVSVPVVLFSAVSDQIKIEGLAGRLKKPGTVEDILDLASKYCEAKA